MKQEEPLGTLQASAKAALLRGCRAEAVTAPLRGESGKAQEHTSDAVQGGWPWTAF